MLLGCVAGRQWRPRGCDKQLWGRTASRPPGHTSIAWPWRAAPAGSHTCSKPASQPGAPCLYPRSPRHHGSHFHDRSGHLSVSTFAFPCPLVPGLLPLPFFMSHLDGTTALSLAGHPKASAPSLFETLQANSPCRIPNSGCKPELGAQVCGCRRDKFINSKKAKTAINFSETHP